MTNDGKASPAEQSPAGKGKSETSPAAEKPDWANGLKQFYDSVVDEPLPDELTQLLAQLDDGEPE